MDNNKPTTLAEIQDRHVDEWINSILAAGWKPATAHNRCEQPAWESQLAEPRPETAC